MQTRAPLVVLALLASASFGAQGVSLSGLVGNILGQPLSGVGIRLGRTGLTATSDASGNWSLAGQVDLAVSPWSRTRTVASRLVLENGRLVVRFDSRNALGQNPSTAVPGASSSMVPATRALADSAAVDTLYYSWKGAVVDKQPLLRWNASGLKEYIDTTGVGGTPVTPGASGIAMAHPIPLASLGQYVAGMKKIPARNRTFLMGLKDSLQEWDVLSQPQHPVSFSYDWYMDSTGVTAREYGRVLTWAITQGYAEVVTDNSNGGRGLYSCTDSIRLLATLIPYGGGSSNRYLGWNEKTSMLEAPSAQDYPMIDGSWYGAVFYANMKSLMAGLETVYDLRTWTIDYAKDGYRLPTEAEWEYSARSGTTTLYYWGDSATYIDKYAITTGYWSVASARPNAYGLYDMIGNGEEWCNDRGGRFPSASLQIDPIGPVNNGSVLDSTRVNRGAGSNRIGIRGYGNADGAKNFRLVLPLR